MPMRYTDSFRHSPPRRLFGVPTVLIAVAALTALAGCGGEETAPDDPSRVERRDSAGVLIVENGREDRPLDWSFEEVLRLGGADTGPESFHQIRVAADALGRIYVLDAGNHRVLVFDSTGSHLQTLGREGTGPGELENPGSLAVTPNGVVGVQDWGRGVVVRWDPGGKPMQPIRLTRPMLWKLQATADGFSGEYATMSGFGEARDSTRRMIVRLTVEDSAAAPIATLAQPPGRPVDLGCVRMSSMDRIFQPDLAWAAHDGRFIIARSDRYELEVRDTAGALLQIVRRDVPPRPATAELAARQVGDSMRVSFGGGRECVIPVETVVEARGFAPTVPAVRSILASPDGRWWIPRGIGRPEDLPTDVFDAEGTYLGTLGPEAPYPTAFLSPDHVLDVETDDLDLQYVVVYRIGRG